MQDLSLHILDLVQNSIRAEASKIDISVLENTERDIFTVTIEDNGCGMNQETLAKAKDPFFTSRTTRDVGLGLSFMQMMAAQCNGKFSVNSEEGKGTKVEITLQRSHIDRLPLGNMAETMMTLVGANENLDFTFNHRVNDQNLDFSTAQMREVLGDDVPLSNFEVLQFISSTIEEETKLLYGGVNT